MQSRTLVLVYSCTSHCVGVIFLYVMVQPLDHSLLIQAHRTAEQAMQRITDGKDGISINFPATSVDEPLKHLASTGEKDSFASCHTYTPSAFDPRSAFWCVIETV